MESEYATAFLFYVAKEYQMLVEPDLVRIGIGGIADTAFCSILQWRKEREAEGCLNCHIRSCRRQNILSWNCL